MKRVALIAALLVSSVARAVALYPQDAQGFSILPLPAPDAIIACASSSSGDDVAGDGTQAKPFRTIAKAKSTFVAGKQALLQLKRGDSWSEPIGSWKWSGGVTAYGAGARPIVKTSSSDGVDVFMNASTPNPLSGVYFVGIDLYADARDPASPTFTVAASNTNCQGVYWLDGGSNVLVEDCVVRFFGNDLSVINQGTPITNFVVRRSIIVDSYNTGAHSQGAYVYGVYRLLFEDDVFDHNGWCEALTTAPATIYNHNTYIDGCQSVVVRGCWTCDASSMGSKINSEAAPFLAHNTLIENNVYLANGNNVMATYGDGTGAVQNAHTNLVIRSNLFTETGRVINNVAQAYGISAVSSNGLWIDSNLFSFSKAGSSMLLELQYASPFTDVRCANNRTYQWIDPSIRTGANSIQQWNNVINVTPSGTPRTVAGYAASIGYASEQALLSAIRLRRGGAWDAKLSAYSALSWVSQGYGFTGKYATQRSPDENADGTVDAADLTIMCERYGQSVTPWTRGDYNGDGKIDVSDLTILSKYYGGGWPPAPAK